MNMQTPEIEEKLKKLMEQGEEALERDRKEYDEKLSKEEKRNAGLYFLEDLQEDIANSKEGLKTGFTMLDNEISLHEGDYVIIAGRPSNGKTTTILNVLLNQIELYPDYTFGLFAYEGNSKSIAIKLIQILSGYDFKGLKQRDNYAGYIKSKSQKISEIEEGKRKYSKYITSGRLKIFATPYVVQDLAEKIAALSTENKLGSVFIDYIQKIKNKDRFGARQLELQKTSEIILETANKTNVPIIMGAQLGRDKDHKDKVQLDNIRECGDIEQDAAIVLGIYNADVEKENKDMTNKAQENTKDFSITILKNRDGDVGAEIPLTFNRRLLKITDGEK